MHSFFSVLSKMVSNTDSFNLKVLYQSLKFQYCDNILCVINVYETRKSLWNIWQDQLKMLKLKKIIIIN